MNLWQTLFLFLIYSFIGWAGESLSKTVKKRRGVNSGFLNGPICPIYGFGGFIMVFLVRLFEKRFSYFEASNSAAANAALFLISFVILSVWEYIVGLLLEKTFHVKYWDYSKKFLNIKGRVCLKNSLYWGVAGVLFAKVFEPWQNRVFLPAIKSVPQNVIIIFVSLAYGALLCDFIASVRSASGLRKALDKVKELSDIIKMRTEELEFHPTEAAKEFAGDKIQSLIIRETRLRLRLSTYADRMKKAFPTMKNEVLGKIELPDFDKNKLKKRLSELKSKR